MLGNMWNAITNYELLDDSGITDVCTVSKETWVFDQLLNYQQKFAESLDEKQSSAFWDIISISDMHRCYQYNRGITEGFVLSNLLRKTVDNPVEAMLSGETLLNGGYEANKTELARLREYFSEVSK